MAHCKTFIPQFESGWHLHDTARKSERVSVFFVVLVVRSAEKHKRNIELLKRMKEEFFFKLYNY